MEALRDRSGIGELERGAGVKVDEGSVDRRPGSVDDAVGRKKALWHRPIGWVGAAVIAMALAGGGRYYVHSLGVESTDDAFVEGHVVPVSPRVSGHVARVRVTDNQAVRRGDVLVELDVRDYQAKLDQAVAALEAAKGNAAAAEAQYELERVTAGAAVEQARAAVRQAEAEHVAARAAVDAAKAEQYRANTELARLAPLESTGAASQQEVIAARAKSQSADAEVTAAEKRAAAAQATIEEEKAKLAGADVAPQRVAAAKAALDEAAAEVARRGAVVDAAKLDLSYTKVVAPADGHVARKSVEAGQYLQPGQAVLALVEPEVWVTANFKETQLERMRPGQEVELKVDAYPGHVFKGKVDSVQRGSGARFSLLPPENATGNYVKVVQRVPVKIVFDDKAVDQGEYVIGPGMSVEPEVKVR